MKKTKTLTLKKETVRHLEDAEAHEVAGGARPSAIRCTETQTCSSLPC